MAAIERSDLPAYISWRTFWTFIEELRAKGSAPHVVDAAVLGSNRSGVTRSLIRGAMRFLGLTDEKKNPTPRLHELISSPNPASVLRMLMEERYEPVISLGLAHATAKQVDAALVEMGSTPSTVQKARVFFIHAATEAQLPLGPFLTARGTTVRKGASPRRRRPVRRTDGRAEPAKTVASVSSPNDPARERYIEMLMKKAEGQDKLDGDLLDRIERLLGYEATDTDEAGV